LPPHIKQKNARHVGRVRQPVPAARFDRTPAAVPSPAPRIGEHTVAILTELGLDATQIERLRTTYTVRLVSAD